MTSKEALNYLKRAPYTFSKEYIEALNIVEQDLKHYYDIVDDYEDLKRCYDELSKKYSLFDYWRDNCLKNDKILDILKRCPFILERLAEKDNGEFAKRYDYGTITNNEVEIIKEAFNL